MFKKSNVVKYMKACKEINVAFIPYEAQVIYVVLLKFVLNMDNELIHHFLQFVCLTNQIYHFDLL